MTREAGHAEMVRRIAAAMKRSKAWPAVFVAGTAEVLARAGLSALGLDPGGCNDVVARRDLDLEQHMRLMEGVSQETVDGPTGSPGGRPEDGLRPDGEAGT